MTVNTFNVDSQWLLLMEQILITPLPRLTGTDREESGWHGSETEETEQFSPRNLQLNWLSRWYGGRVVREKTEGETDLITHKECITNITLQLTRHSLASSKVKRPVPDLMWIGKQQHLVNQL